MGVANVLGVDQNAILENTLFEDGDSVDTFRAFVPAQVEKT